jgi:hypothetical protein
MSQDDRRRLAARARLVPRPRSEAEVPSPLRIRRYSEGLEHAPVMLPRIGRFSRGGERLPEDDRGKQRVGRYSDGLEDPARRARAEAHVGRFSQGGDHCGC